jgi:hypothetical protein
VSRVPGPRARLLHSAHVVSRSGRASAPLGEVDLDEEKGDLAETCSTLASTAYHPARDPDRHRELAEALFAAAEELEDAPGQPRSAERALPDGRRVRIERRIDGP